MDYIKTYKSFINSHYLTEGLRITSGVLLPAFAMSYFGMLPTGIIVSLGALFVSITDSPGPIHHRKNGMTVCIAAILIVTLVAGFISAYPVLLALFLAVSCFFFSMIGIYGARATSIGLAAMIVLTLSLDPRLNFSTSLQVMQHSLLMASGGLWYLCYSMLLYNVRPYRLPQQALGDYLESTAAYLLIRAELYKNDADYEKIFQQLLQQQAVVQHKHTELTELLFKTRSIVKETTNIGRTLVMIHLEVADIFERIMMSHQQYSQLHTLFDNTGILTDFYLLAKEISAELEEVGIAIKSGESSQPNNTLTDHIKSAKEKLDALRLTVLSPDNIEGFISLRRILENVQDLADRLATLHKYTSYDTTLSKKLVKDRDLDKLVSHQQITPAMFIDNLTMKSDIFRHSLRVSIAILAGFVTALFFNIGHSYWILLTIVVILKPAFSLTKKRNGDRLAGTFAGILIGIIIVYFIHNDTVLLILLILFMTGAYSFMRVNYFIMVLLMTPYLVLFYHLLHPQDFTVLLQDRVIDTVIGSAIAFVASTFLFPSWEREKITPLMIEMVTEVKNYFSVISSSFNNNDITFNVQQLARKNVLVALANLSEAFNRMLSEPKSHRQGIEKLHQFVVLNHTLTSYIATLFYYIHREKLSYQPQEFLPVAQDILHYLDDAVNNFNKETPDEVIVIHKDSLRKLNEQADKLLLKRKDELEHGLLETSTRKSLFDMKSLVNQVNLIYNAAIDINKISKKLKMD